MYSLVCKEVGLSKLQHIVRLVNEQRLQEVCQECPQLGMLPNVLLVVLFNLSLHKSTAHSKRLVTESLARDKSTHIHCTH